MTDTREQRLREQACELLRALGLDPYYIPLDAHIHWDGERVHVDHYVRREDGAFMLTDQHDDMQRERVAIPVTVPDDYQPSYEEGSVGD